MILEYNEAAKMNLNFEGIELSDEQKAAINDQNSGLHTQEELDSQVSGLKAKRDELMDLQKKAKQATEAAEADAEKARMESLQKGKNHEELAKSWEAKHDALSTQMELSRAKDNKLALKNKALQLATPLAEGYNVTLLAEQFEKRLKHDGESLKVTDKDGALTISTFEELSTEFKANKELSSLIVKTKASGGDGDGEKTETKIAITSKGTIDMNAHKENIVARLAKNHGK